MKISIQEKNTINVRIKEISKDKHIESNNNNKFLKILVWI